MFSFFALIVNIFFLNIAKFEFKVHYGLLKKKKKKKNTNNQLYPLLQIVLRMFSAFYRRAFKVVCGSYEFHREPDKLMCRPTYNFCFL